MGHQPHSQHHYEQGKYGLDILITVLCNYGFRGKKRKKADFSERMASKGTVMVQFHQLPQKLLQIQIHWTDWFNILLPDNVFPSHTLFKIAVFLLRFSKNLVLQKHGHITAISFMNPMLYWQKATAFTRHVKPQREWLINKEKQTEDN